MVRPHVDIVNTDWYSDVDNDYIAAKEHGHVEHTVGGPDGGPGLPGTGWSTEHGDLRVVHFLGLHALQALPIVALVLARRRLSEVVRLRLTITAAASYVALFGILLSQAFRGQSVLAPDALTIALVAIWAFGTAAAAAASAVRAQPGRTPAAV